MKMMKRIVSLVLAMVLTLALAAPAMAAEYTPTKMEKATAIADVLYKAGLFAGIGKDENGKPIYALDSNATRAQAMVMLVRILGKEKESSTAPASPFTDVPAWAAPAVNYGYANKLTNGTSKTTFGSNSMVTNTQYISFCLYALGYSPDDFHWNKAHEFAYELGALTKGEYDNANDPCSRADLVIITYAILQAKLKGSDKTLSESINVTLDKPVMPEKPSIPEWIEEQYEVRDTKDPAAWLDYSMDNKPGHEDYRYRYDEPDNLHVFDSIINQYDETMTPKENFQKFMDIYAALNSNHYTLWIDEEDSKDVLINHHKANGWGNPGQKTIYYDNITKHFVVSDIGHNYWDMQDRVDHPDYKIGWPGMNPWLLNILSFFDHDFARQVLTMMTDFYNNSDVVIERIPDEKNPWGPPIKVIMTGHLGPLTKEMVEKYGLTYLGEGDSNWWNGGKYTIVTNGTITAKVTYDIPSEGSRPDTSLLNIEFWFNE